MNFFLKNYLKKYFKNIEKFDFSLINGKVKIDSVVPKLDSFTHLLNLEKLNLKIENGLIRDLTINFPINILKSSIKILIKNVDIYITSTEGLKETLLKGITEVRKYSDNDKKISTNNDQVDDSFWLKVKDDIVANLIIEIENVNLYIFLKEFIIKNEIKNISFSPSIINNSDEFAETFIKDAKNGNYRKYLILQSIKTSIDTKMEEITKQESYVIKNMKLYCILDFLTQQKKRRNKIILENFLFDSDISDFGKLVGIVQDFFEIINKNKIEEQKDQESSFESDKYSHRSSEIIYETETTFLAENTNINFTYNKLEKILFNLILNDFEFTISALNEKKIKFDNLYIFLPVLKNIDSQQRSSIMYSNNIIPPNTCTNNFNDYIKIRVKNYNEDTSIKTFSFNVKLVIDKKKYSLLSERISIKYNKSMNKMVTNNVVAKIDIMHLKWILSSLNNLGNVLKKKVNLSRKISRIDLNESNLGDDSDDNFCYLKIPFISFSLGKYIYFNNDVKLFAEIVAFKLFSNKMCLNSNYRIMEFTNENEIYLSNLLTHKKYKLIEGIKFEYRFENKTHKLGFQNTNINLSSYSINFILSLYDFISICTKNNDSLNVKEKSPNSIFNYNTEEGRNESRLFFSTLNNCTSYIFEVSVFGNDNLSYLLKPFNEKEFLNKIIKLKLFINDTNFECLLDISQIFMNISWNETNSEDKNSQMNIRKEEIDFIMISLIDSDQRIKNFYLFYSYENSNKSVINFYIFDLYIIIHNFPSPTTHDIKKFLISNQEITSNFELMYENSLQNIKLTNHNDSPILCFVCDNFLFRNFFNFEIELEIGYEDSKEIIAIPPREEKSVLIFLDRLKYAFFYMKNYKHFKCSNLISEDLYDLLKSNRISPESIKQYFKVYQNTVGKKVSSNSKVFQLLVTMDDFNIVFKLQHNESSKMKIINLMPTLIIRNVTSISKLFICCNNYTDKIYNDKFSYVKKVNETENSDLEFEFDQNILEVFRGDNTLTLNEDNLSKIRFGFCLNETNYYFSQSLNIKDNKELIFSIKLVDYNESLCKFLIFRMKIKSQNLNIVLLTISSFLNFSITNSSISRLFIQNKFSDNIEDKQDSIIITTSSDICSDFCFILEKTSNKNNFYYDADNIFNIVNLVKSLKNKLDFLIEERTEDETNIFYSGVYFKDIFLKDVYFLNTINLEYLSEKDIAALLKDNENTDRSQFVNKSNNSLKDFIMNCDRKKRKISEFNIKNKVYNLRFINSPFYVFEICEFYKTNNYIYIENLSSFNLLFSINSHYNFYSETKTVSEFSVDKIESFFIYMVQISKKNYKLEQPLFLVKYEKFIENNLTKFFEEKILLEVTKKINKFYIRIFNNHSDEYNKYNRLVQSEQSNVFLDISDVNLNFDFIPFYLDIKSTSMKKEIKIYLESPKILANFIFTSKNILYPKSMEIKPKHANYYLSVNIVNFKIFKFINDNQFDYIIKTKYMTDIKINFETIFNAIRSNYLINFIKVSFPIETDIFIDDILSQIAMFINKQINAVSERSFLNIKFNEDIKILNFLSMPKIQSIYCLEEFILNEFLFNFSVEMKKGISISVKNSSIKTNSVKLHNFVGNSKNFSDEVKSNIFKNLINHIYNLLTSAEIFGNFNQLYTEISQGFKKLLQKPFTTGIFSFFYISLKGSFKSIYGIGRSIGKTLIFTKNTVFEKKINELYKENLFHQVNSNLLTINCIIFLSIDQQILNADNSNLVIKSDKKYLAELFKNERQLKMIQFQEIDQFSEFFIQCNLSSYFTEEIKYILFSKNRSEKFILIFTNYYFCICTLKEMIKVEYLIPFMQINGIGVFNNRVSISLKNSNKIEINLHNKKFKDIMKYEIIDKFEEVLKNN